MSEGQSELTSTSFQSFLQMYSQLDRLEDGYVFIAKQYIGRNQVDMGKTFLKEALRAKTTCFEAHYLLAEHTSDKNQKLKHLNDSASSAFKKVKAPEMHILLGNSYFAEKEHERALKLFEIAYAQNSSLSEALANTIYLRSNLCIWGKNGSQFMYGIFRRHYIFHCDNFYAVDNKLR